jgi:hypothetical protein
MTSLAISSTTKWSSILTPIAIDGHGRIGPMLRQNLYGTSPPPIPPQIQFKPNRPNAKAMYKWATTLPAPIGIFIEAEMETTPGRTSTTKTKILRTQSFSSHTINSNNPTTRSRHCSCLENPHYQFLQKAFFYSPNSPAFLTITISSYLATKLLVYC